MLHALSNVSRTGEIFRKKSKPFLLLSFALGAKAMEVTGVKITTVVEEEGRENFRVKKG